MKGTRVRLAALAMLLSLAAMTAAPARAVANATETRLYFGMDIPPGTRCNPEGTAKQVTPDEWQRFVREEVVLRFDGFTVVEASGYWKGAREGNHVIVFVYEKGDDAPGMNTRLIAQAYVERFCQDGVLRVDKDAVMELIERR